MSGSPRGARPMRNLMESMGQNLRNRASKLRKRSRVTQGPRTLRPTLGWFVDKDGYTSLAVVLAVLMSLTLVFAAASSTWTMSRSADIQEVADAAALAGSNAVAAFSTTAQVLDACVLTLGLTGLAVMACALILACVPGLEGAAQPVLDAGREVLQMRSKLATAAAKGLRAFEGVLPALIVVNSASCVSANSSGGAHYLGCAVPVPTASGSDYGALEDMDDAGELTEAAQELAEATRKAEELERKAHDALERGWWADCGATPYSMYQRASTLSTLSAAQNPYYASTQGWNFGVPLSRARAYYAARIQAEAPLASDMESVTDSCCRKVFYTYALARVRAGYYREAADGSVSIYLPEFPHNTDEVRATTLYTDHTWPCTWENGTKVLHSTLDCPGAVGERAGTASLSELEAGTVLRCEVCDMRVSCMGKVAAASTTIENGFEHWWREVVEASKDYERTKNELVRVENEMRSKADSAKSIFKQLLGELSVTRPKIKPPGAYGCVALVTRSQGETVPSELTDAFLASSSLPQGVAVSAATLAPDTRSAENNVLSRLADGAGNESTLSGLASSAAGLWGSLLNAYTSAYESMSDVIGDALDSLDGVFGLGSWLRQKLDDVVEVTGLSPGDMRLKKPVLTSSAKVLAADGIDEDGYIRQGIQGLANSNSYLEMARVLGVTAVLANVGDKITVAEIPIPGTTKTIPLEIDLKKLMGVE